MKHTVIPRSRRMAETLNQQGADCHAAGNFYVRISKVEYLKSDLVMEAGINFRRRNMYSDTQSSQTASAFNSAGKTVAESDGFHCFADDE